MQRDVMCQMPFQQDRDHVDSVVGVEQVLTAVADHDLTEILVPAEVNAKCSVFRILGADLEVLPHFNDFALIRERSGALGLWIVFNRL